MAVSAGPEVKDAIAARLDEARERTLQLVEPLSDEQLNRVYSPILSPLAWDLGHIANFEELWLVQTIGGREPMRGELGRYYDAIENPRSVRNELPILRGAELRAYMAEVRERTLEVLRSIDLDAGDDLLRDGYVYDLILAHEHQHNETMLQLLQMVDGYEPVAADPGAAGRRASDGPEMVLVEGGEVEVGAGPGGFAYDNERPRHVVDLDPFWIDRTPVTNGNFTAFLADTGADPPMYWEPDGAGGWVRTVMGQTREVDPSLPVVHVDWHQADAFARWAGKRLPTEAEWEAAATGADRERANLDQLAFGCAPAGAFGDAPADCGAVQMLGDVWEWTGSDFTAYPGFEAFPYPEYSEVFFGPKYKVLRGGAWATRREVIRPSFRNWDLPERRQIFAGLRCAADGEEAGPRVRARTPAVKVEVHLPPGGPLSGMAADVRIGLTKPFKELSPRYFYDERGSELFEAITKLPEYYPTRAERAILERHSAAIAAAGPATLIELGSGSASKTRMLLDAMRDAGSLEAYAPVDISEEITRATAEAVAKEYGIAVHGLVCDFERDLERIPLTGPRVIAFLGGTIGNFEPSPRAGFLARIANLLGPADRFLLGTDLIKDRATLEAAYNDAAGVTAEFNKNALAVLNRELGADFDPGLFEHVAFWDDENLFVDIRLRSLRRQIVAFAELGLTVPFERGEEMRTEISTKFAREGLEGIYREAGLELVEWWTDPEELFALSLARRQR